MELLGRKGPRRGGHSLERGPLTPKTDKWCDVVHTMLWRRGMFYCGLGENAMSNTRLDQSRRDPLLRNIDEALESAAGTKRAANYTLYYCTALDLCPVPNHCALKSAIAAAGLYRNIPTYKPRR